MGSRKGVPKSALHRLRISQTMKGKPKTEATRKRMKGKKKPRVKRARVPESSIMLGKSQLSQGKSMNYLVAVEVNSRLRRRAS
ncbi:hypothetical protein MUP77_19665 [Candidatus Bathyarchaeota archaeon]|nr:hypothetical protein [Candidatus Bathyarchaeota archaeon]